MWSRCRGDSRQGRMARGKYNLIFFGLSSLLWILIGVVHCVIHVRRVSATDHLYGYEKDVGFIAFGFVFVWGIYYFVAIVLTVLALELLRFLLRKG